MWCRFSWQQDTLVWRIDNRIAQVRDPVQGSVELARAKVDLKRNHKSLKALPRRIKRMA